MRGMFSMLVIALGSSQIQPCEPSGCPATTSNHVHWRIQFAKTHVIVNSTSMFPLHALDKWKGRRKGPTLPGTWYQESNKPTPYSPPALSRQLLG
jgi:hypothetical protein